MKNNLIQFIALCLLMLVTGLFWGTWFSLSRSIDTFSPTEFIHIGRTIIQNVANPMRLIMPSCIVFMGISMWNYSLKKSMGFYLNASAFILIIIALLITLFVEVPIDNHIKEWTVSTLPTNWEAIRVRWEFFHGMRTFISLLSFAGFAGSILLNKTYK